MIRFHRWTFAAALALLLALGCPAHAQNPGSEGAVGAYTPQAVTSVRHRTVRIDDIDLFYREAGRADAPAILLLHGFPSSSHMFRRLIPLLADRYRIVAPDYPGFGQSSMPAASEFEYTFDRLAEVMERFTEAVGLTHYALYMHDYGAPVGFRLAVSHPERITALVVQNGNVYEEGLHEFWEPLRAYWNDRSAAQEAKLRGFLTLPSTRWLYTHGVGDTALVSPDAWTIDQALLDRSGNQEIQLALFYDYSTNPQRYPDWQAYMRRHQPPTLVVWGKNDHLFAVAGAHAFERDLKEVEIHLLDTGHFALEEKAEEIAGLMRAFLSGYEGVPRPRAH
jgi:pimeloyl-ACP methyl ester carboxylesterase